ncbi:MAG: SagB/ThcOx family dehydrogenase [candidate division WOR-3 bacterium]
MISRLLVLRFLLMCVIPAGACKAAGNNPKLDWRAFQELTAIKTGQATGLGLTDTSAEIKLPSAPELDIGLSTAIKNRRSRRELSDEGITLEELSALVYYTIGITDSSYGTSLRAAPSAGALYPTELVVAVHRVESLEPGLYRYKPERHCLVFYKKGNIKGALPAIALNQAHAGRGACAIIISSRVQRSTGKYGQRGYRYAMIDAGAAAENLYLTAEALGLGTVAIGAFGDEALANLLGLDEDELPLLLMPVGHREK